MMFVTLSSMLLTVFMPPTTLTLQARPSKSVSVAMQFPELPKLPKIDFGGIEFESFGDKWNSPGDLKLIPSDVQFEDVDGDVITLRGTRGGRVDYYVGKKMKLEKAVLEQSGNSLLVTGKISKGTPLSMFGFNLEETITDQMTPKDPEAVAKAMALVQ